jgi:hypothetical protein
LAWFGLEQQLDVILGFTTTDKRDFMQCGFYNDLMIGVSVMWTLVKWHFLSFGSVSLVSSFLVTVQRGSLFQWSFKDDLSPYFLTVKVHHLSLYSHLPVIIPLLIRTWVFCTLRSQKKSPL